MKKAALAFVLVALVLVCAGCGGKPSNVSQDVYEHAVEALNVLDKLLDKDTNASNASKELNDLYDSIKKDKTDQIGDSLIASSVLIAGSGVSRIKWEGDEGDNYEKVLETRNRLASHINKNSRTSYKGKTRQTSTSSSEPSLTTPTPTLEPAPTSTPEVDPKSVPITAEVSMYAAPNYVVYSKTVEQSGLLGRLLVLEGEISDYGYLEQTEYAVLNSSGESWIITWPASGVNNAPNFKSKQKVIVYGEYRGIFDKSPALNLLRYVSNGEFNSLLINGEEAASSSEAAALLRIDIPEKDLPIPSHVPERTQTPSKEDAAPSGQAAVNSGRITLMEFNAIKTGMSYSKVCEIIGSKGELMAETDLGIGSEYISRSYSWQGSGDLGANAIIIFTGNKVISKAQYGLK